MIVFRETYERLNGKLNGGKPTGFDPSHLGCLLTPEKYSAKAEKNRVVPYYEVSAATRDIFYRLSADSLNALAAIRASKGLVYALLAPAFTGQFGNAVTPDKLRPALKALGFTGVVEVALFADILTLKEAIEFSRNIKSDNDFQITSCCCPMWIAMIKKIYHELMPHMPASVSPMIAGGRVIKQIYPDAVTVFIGPCMAKKAEAKEPDLVGAIDHVLTFKELQDIFDALKIDPSDYPESGKDHSSYSGRVYARAMGVSEAVSETLKRIDPERKIGLRAEHADGVHACKGMIDRLMSGEINANFFEGMGCQGGCIGGPKACIPPAAAESKVEEYSLSSYFHTPIDNPYIIELLHKIGIDNEKQLFESELFIRRLSHLI